MRLLNKILIVCFLNAGFNHEAFASDKDWKTSWKANIQKNQMALDLQIVLEQIQHDKIQEIKKLIDAFMKDKQESYKKWAKENGNLKTRQKSWKDLTPEERTAKKLEREEYWHKDDEKAIQLAHSIEAILSTIEDVTDPITKAQILITEPLISNFVEKLEAE